MSNIPSNLKIFTPKGTEPDAGAVQQITTCMTSGDAAAGSLSADHHLGYSAPIGASIGYADYVSPSSVGYDISCGNATASSRAVVRDIMMQTGGRINGRWGYAKIGPSTLIQRVD